MRRSDSRIFDGAFRVVRSRVDYDGFGMTLEEVKAVLSDSGAPVEGAEVALTYQASVSGETGRVEIAWATTDESGVAILTYEQRADENGEMQVVYVGPDTDPVETPVLRGRSHHRTRTQCSHRGRWRESPGKLPMRRTGPPAPKHC